MLKIEQLPKLLGRPLTTYETTNFNMYLKIATQRLEELLCIDLSSNGSRTYETRVGYRTVYVDPFTELNSLTLDGETVTSDDYTLKQFDKLNARWFNIIEFDAKQNGKKIVVNAEWGFGSCPTDLQLLLAKLFAQGSTEQDVDNSVKSKKIEDFTVTYKDNATFDDWLLANRSLIDKYSLCNQGYIRQGATDVRSVRYY